MGYQVRYTTPDGTKGAAEFDCHHDAWAFMHSIEAEGGIAGFPEWDKTRWRAAS